MNLKVTLTPIKNDTLKEQITFLAHLFVDDAFVFGDTHTENDRHINEYVKILIDVLNEAAENVHQRPVRIRPPRIYVTPYGGRVQVS